MGPTYVFRSKELVTDVISDALVIACSDRRFQRGFREFLTDHLGLEHWDSIIVPGGPYLLAWPDLTEVGDRMAGFLMGLSAPRRIVLISHHGCVRYQTSYPPEAQPVGFSLQEQQCLDLRAVSAKLRATYPAAEVTAFYADAGENGSIVFEPV